MYRIFNFFFKLTKENNRYCDSCKNFAVRVENKQVSDFDVDKEIRSLGH